MQLGMVGLGRMGGNIVRRLLKDGHQGVVYDRDPAAVEALVKDGATGAASLEDLVSKLDAPRAVWVMLPAGHITETTIDQLGKLLGPDDVIIDGGNTFWQDDIRRAKTLREKSIAYVDVGTSGGIWGFERGYCMMIGGDKQVVDRLDPIFATLAPASAIFRARRAVRIAIPASNRGISTPARSALAISSRWSTTASSTA